MQLAEATGDNAEICATDIDAKRLERVRENIARLGLGSIEIVPYDVGWGSPHQGSFDAVLLDVPCSNTGVMAKRIEVRFRTSSERLKKLAKTQRGLLDRAAGLVKPGGKICYSTCSIQKGENAEVVKGLPRG